MDPAILRELGSQFTRVAGGLPQQRADAGSVADAAADAAFEDFNRRWSAHLRACAEVVDRAAHQAQLTALAFELVDGR